MNISVGSPHWRPVSLGLLAGIALVLVLLFRMSGPSVALEQWLASGKQEVQTIHGLVARHQAYVRQASAARKKLNDSITAVLHVVKVQQEAGASLLTAARTAAQYKAAGEVLARNAQVCVDALTLCRNRGDSLARADSVHTDSLRVALRGADTTIARGVHLVECHLIHAGPIKLFGCPSRKQAFELGTVLGVLGTLVFTHR